MARESAVATVDKMLRVIHLSNDLAQNQDCAESSALPLADFAQRAGLTERDARRVIKKINLGCGDSLPELFIDLDEESGTVVPHAMRIALDKPLRLSPIEAQALIMALESAGIEGADAIARKIEGAFPQLDRERFASIKNTAQGANLGPVLATVARATGECRVLRIAYRGADDRAATERDIEPRALLFDSQEGTWYANAWCRRAGDWRTFRVTRIEGALLLDERFEPDGEPAHECGLQGIDQAERAVVAVHDPSALPSIVEWRGLERLSDRSGTGRGERFDGVFTPAEQKAGAYLAAIPWQPGSPWLARMIARSFGAVEALRPPELRRAVIAEVQRFKALYPFASP